MSGIDSRNQPNPFTLLFLPPPLPVPAAAALRMRPAPPGVSACSATVRSFSPLCYTDSGFNSDSTQTSSGPRGSASRSVSAFLSAGVEEGSFRPLRFGPRGSGPGSPRDTLLLKRVCGGGEGGGGGWRRRALQLHTGGEEGGVHGGCKGGSGCTWSERNLLSVPSGSNRTPGSSGFPRRWNVPERSTMISSFLL